MKGLIEFLFYEKAYGLACRKLKKESLLRSNRKYDILKPNIKEWYADSFCVEHNDNVYIFCEIMRMKRGIGSLGVTEYNPHKGTFTPVKEIIKEDFHMSYPNVFRFNDRYYMIPETFQANEIRLYEATNFPFEWRLNRTLVSNIAAVDTSISQIGDGLFLLYSFLPFSKPQKTVAFIMNMYTGEVEYVPKIANSMSSERPGGNILTVDGCQYRVVQDCTRYYGEKLKFYRIIEMKPEDDIYKEEYYGELTALDVECDKRYTRIHTLTRSENFEAIDLYYDKFYIYKPIRMLLNTIKRKA